MSLPGDYGAWLDGHRLNDEQLDRLIAYQQRDVAPSRDELMAVLLDLREQRAIQKLTLFPGIFAPREAEDLARARRKRHLIAGGLYGGYIAIQRELEEFWTEAKKIPDNSAREVAALARTAAMCQVVAGEIVRDAATSAVPHRGINDPGKSNPRDYDSSTGFGNDGSMEDV